MGNAPLRERFADALPSPRLSWINRPNRWAVEHPGQTLRIEPDAETDFWQRTHYGFSADTGHMLALQAGGDFVLETQVTLQPANQYDQAGLMLRISPTCWVKTAIEYEPHGPNLLGAVVTNAGYSDWSTQPVTHDLTALWLRIRLEAEDCIVDCSLDGEGWSQLRMAHLMERAHVADVSCGLYACSPKAAGFVAQFHYLYFQPGRL